VGRRGARKHHRRVALSATIPGFAIGTMGSTRRRLTGVRMDIEGSNRKRRPPISLTPRVVRQPFVRWWASPFYRQAYYKIGAVNRSVAVLTVLARSLPSPCS
jgi:hypothetical protein